MTGLLHLVGGAEFTDTCAGDEGLAARAEADEVLLLPTAAAYENPAKLIARAEAWFGAHGVGVRTLPVYRRADANDPALIAPVTAGRLVYLAGGSPLHLRSVLKDTVLWEAIVAAWEGGAALAGAGAGATVLGDHMVDPRGGAYTVGLGLLRTLAVIPRDDEWSPEKLQRTVELAPAHLALAAIPHGSALERSPDGSWSTHGPGAVTIYQGGVSVGLEALPAELW